MNRRRFLELLGMAAAGTGIVYSFPSVIVPKNIASQLSQFPSFSWDWLASQPVPRPSQLKDRFHDAFSSDERAWIDLTETAFQDAEFIPEDAILIRPFRKEVTDYRDTTQVITFGADKKHRGVAELVDAGDLKSPAPKGVQVQVLSPRPS